MSRPTDELKHIQTEEVRFFLSQASKRKVYSTTSLAVLLVLTLSQPHLAFLLLVLAIPFFAWLTYSAYVLVRRPYARVAQTICILIWLIAVAIIVLIHTIGHQSARRDANEIVQNILAYQMRFNRCPLNLEGMLTPHPQLARRFKADFAYECVGRKPHLSYPVTFALLDRYEYDFEHGGWHYQSWARKKYFMTPEEASQAPAAGSATGADRLP